MSMRPHVSVPKKAILVYCRWCSLRIVGRIYFSSVLVPDLRSSNESFIVFLKAGIPVLQAIGVRIHCVSREYLQLFETFFVYILYLTK